MIIPFLRKPWRAFELHDPLLPASPRQFFLLRDSLLRTFHFRHFISDFPILPSDQTSHSRLFTNWKLELIKNSETRSKKSEPKKLEVINKQTDVKHKKSGRYKVRKEPSPAKRCEKMRKERKICEKSHVLWKKNSLCYIMYIKLNLDHIDVIKN